MHVSSVDYGNELPPAAEQPTSIGRIKPELYKQKSVDGDDAKSEAAKSCGKINFSLRYDYESETLIVRILKAFDLPAKDFCGSSDPYVKIYLLPDRKCKLQTRVHRKTLNPTFDENFHFPVPYEELADRKLHLSVFDFDRFSRHDMIGEVILDNLFEASDLSRETSIWKDIQYATSVSTAPPPGLAGSQFWVGWGVSSSPSPRTRMGLCPSGCAARTWKLTSGPARPGEVLALRPRLGWRAADPTCVRTEGNFYLLLAMACSERFSLLARPEVYYL